jgi:hypothetical protein
VRGAHEPRTKPARDNDGDLLMLSTEIVASQHGRDIVPGPAGRPGVDVYVRYHVAGSRFSAFERMQD